MADSSEDFDQLLDAFISSQLEDAKDVLAELNDPETPSKTASDEPISIEQQPFETVTQSFSLNESVNQSLQTSQVESALAEEEQQLYKVYREFIEAVIACGSKERIPQPSFTLKAEDLIPRFRPRKTLKKLKNDILAAWDVLLKAQPSRLSSLPENPTDEQILSFAEKTTDLELQMALISYVETLIEIDACEIAYNIRRAKYEKYKIEKQIFEEQQNRRERIKKYIEAIRKNRFPVDAEMLVNNFFKTFRKDPENAQKVLEVNPATFAPIQIEKIPAKLFGLIKAKPEDGFKINKKLGKFLKHLKA